MAWFKRRSAVSATASAKFTSVYTFPPCTVRMDNGPQAVTIGVFYLQRPGENTLCFGTVVGPNHFWIKAANTVDHAYRAAVLLAELVRQGSAVMGLSILEDCDNAALARLEWQDSLRPGGLAYAVAQRIGEAQLRSLRAQPLPSKVVAAQLKHAQQQ